MKKRIILLFFIALLIIQLASAEIIINDVENSVYNKGEELLISGTILRDEEVEGGSLNFVLMCENLEFSLPPLTITIKAKKSKEFATESFKIPPPAEGECFVETSLLFDEAVLEEQNSESFEVSDELKVEEEEFNKNFEIKPMIKQVQLGGELTIYGYVTNINDNPITGLATIYFKTEDKTYYVDDVQVSEGKLEYTYQVTNNKPGEYYMDILVRDVYGNQKLFKDVIKFTIIDEVHIFVEPIQRKVLPGDEVKISGKVNTILGEEVEEGKLQIILGNEIYSVDVKNGNFDYDLKLPENIETGKHILMFSFTEQGAGNWGGTDRTFYIQAIPTQIKILNYQDSVRPEQLLDVVVFLYDQANNEIEESAKLEFIDPNGKTHFLESVTSGEKTSMDIDQYAVPGTWKLKATYLELTFEKEVTVEEFENIEVELINETVYIKNTGNVIYDDKISIELDEGDFVLTKKVSMDPEETLTIDLTKEAPSGQYSMAVTGAAIVANKFDDVIIVGKNKKSLNFIYSFMMIFIISSLAYLTIFKKRHFANVKMRTDRDVKHAKFRLKKLRLKKEKQQDKKPAFSKEENIVDFRERMLRDIRKTEDKISSEKKTNSIPDSPKNSFSSPSSEEKKEDDKPKGLFNMFS